MSQIFFLIGIRRSGTSITRELLLESPEIHNIDFEPHDLWNAVDLEHFPRLMNDLKNAEWARDKIENFKARPGVHGAKFALNPGVKALEWRWLYKVFPGAKFIFLTRNVDSTYPSYKKADENSLRGVIGQDAYYDLAGGLICDFIQYAKDNQATAVWLKYENILQDPDSEIGKAYDLLGVQRVTGLKRFIKKPENL